LVALSAFALCALPFWLWSKPVHSYFLKLDDFVYLARSRTSASLLQHLFAPLNGHVVPLFLLETHLLARFSGSLEALPQVLGCASYGTLVLAMGITGHIVAWETGRAARGLAAMAAVGCSSVLGPAILWYAAGQALVAGVVVLLMLAALQAFRARGAALLLAAGTLAAAAAPLFWTAGYTAGLVGLVYLWVDGRRSCRIASLLPLSGSLVTAFAVWSIATPAMAAATQLSLHSTDLLIRLSTIGTHITRAICEALVLNNLGLDAPTSAMQSVVLCGILAGLWLWSTRRRWSNSGSHRWRLNPLEAGGAALVVTNLGLIFAARGSQMRYDNLRALGWYDAIPQLGAALFAAGWWSGRVDSPPPRSIALPHCRELLGVAVFATIISVLQAPRAQRVIFRYDGAAAVVPGGDPATRPRSRADLVDRARRQRQVLAELDLTEQTARDQRQALARILEAVRKIDVPGMPKGPGAPSAAQLLDISEPKAAGKEARSPRSASDGIGNQ
jgi:hypothetical protein